MDNRDLELELPSTPENIPTSWNQAHLVDDAINHGELSITDAQTFEDFENLLPEIVHTTMFVELHKERLAEMGNVSQGEALENLLSEKSETNESVLDILAENRISLSIAMQDGFEDDIHMVNAFKSLNEKGITPTFWIVLNDEQGYWTGKSNVEKTVEKIEKVIKWAKENNIDIKRIGLDYEPSIQVMKGLINVNVPQIKKSLSEYSKSAKESKGKVGDPEKYINGKIAEIIKQHNISFETYVGKEPLLTLSQLVGLTIKPSKLSEIAPMVYTSVYPKDDEEKTFNALRDGVIPSLGITGADPYNTPGRDLRLEGMEKKPELHLSYKQLESNFRHILSKNEHHSPFRTHNVFALDKLITLQNTIKARRNAIYES